MKSPAASRRPPHLRLVGAFAVAGLLAGVAIQRFTGIFNADRLVEEPLVLVDGGEFPVGRSSGAFFDFGRVPEDVIVHRRILLRNSTESALIVTGMRSTCPCAGATVMQPAISPGSAREMDIWVRLGGGRTRTRAGIFVDFHEESGGRGKRTVLIGLHATLGATESAELTVLPSAIRSGE